MTMKQILDGKSSAFSEESRGSRTMAEFGSVELLQIQPNKLINGPVRLR